MTRVAVVTPTVETRGHLLAELAASIAAQTEPPDEWHVAYDLERRGPAETINCLVGATCAEWVFPMGDDDLFQPHHFATLRRHLNDDVDIVWTLPEIPANRGLQAALALPFHADDLDQRNVIAAAAAVRRSLWVQLGGYSAADADEDWGLWQRAKAAGARFHRIDVRTWTYRLDDAWPHRSRRQEV